jgi:hypothetical protein
VRFSVNPTTGDLTVDTTGIDTGPCCSGFTTNTNVVLSPITDTSPINVTPGPSDLPDVGQDVPGLDSVSVEGSPSVDAYGLDEYGVCHEYATGLVCDDDDATPWYIHHEYVHHEARAIPSPEAVVLTLLGIAVLMTMARRMR